MLDAGTRGWVLLIAGAALMIGAGYRGRWRGSSRRVLWGELLIGAMVILQGVATHVERLADGGFEWLYWAALATGATGIAMIWRARSRPRTS